MGCFTLIFFMFIYRLVNEKYKGNLTGMGAFLNGGRWNYVEQYMLYAAQHISLALVEVLVHQRIGSQTFLLQTLELPSQKNYYKKIELNKLPKDWDNTISITQKIGAAFLKNDALLYCVVPSIIVQQEYNILINPNSPNFGLIKIISEEKFDVDKRLI
jgi:RES domain-containing protein